MKRALIILLLVAGCSSAGAQRGVDEQQMYMIAAALTKLAAAVDTFVGSEDYRSSMTDTDVLQRATSHDLTLLALFANFHLRVRREDSYASVLVCTSDGLRGLLEDLGCTAPLDAHLWREPTEAPCEFTLKVAETCSAPK